MIAIVHKAVGHLLKAAAAADTEMWIAAGEARAFTATYGDWLYALVIGAQDREIIRINIAASDPLNKCLVVERSQGGSSAPAVWPVGTVLIAIDHADFYNALVQLSEIRTVSFNPNDGALAPNYAGEKVYQDSPLGCLRWWKAYNAVDPYWDIITGNPCGNEAYQDVGWDFDLLKAVV